MHMASAVPFSCVHTAATEKSSEPLSAKVLTAEDIQAYKCDKATEEKLLQHLDPPEDFRHMVKVSEHSFAMESYIAVIRIAIENWEVANK